MLFLSWWPTTATLKADKPVASRYPIEQNLTRSNHVLPSYPAIKDLREWSADWCPPSPTNNTYYFYFNTLNLGHLNKSIVLNW